MDNPSSMDDDQWIIIGPIIGAFIIAFCTMCCCRCERRKPKEEVILTLNPDNLRRTPSGKRIILSLPANSSVSGQQFQVENGMTNYVLPPSYLEAVDNTGRPLPYRASNIVQAVRY